MEPGPEVEVKVPGVLVVELIVSPEPPRWAYRSPRPADATTSWYRPVWSFLCCGSCARFHHTE